MVIGNNTCHFKLDFLKELSIVLDSYSFGLHKLLVNKGNKTQDHFLSPKYDMRKNIRHKSVAL